MDAFRGFMGGLVATVPFALVLGGAAYQGNVFDLPLYLGTTFLEPSSTAWGVGVALVFVLGGIFGMVHASVFEDWARSGPILGAITGLGHATATGVALGFAAQVHPLIPEGLADPGYFGNLLGDGVSAALITAHVLFGATVGSLYRPRSKP